MLQVVSPYIKQLDPFMGLIINALHCNPDLIENLSVPDPATQWKEFVKWYRSMDEKQIVYWEEVVGK